MDSPDTSSRNQGMELLEKGLPEAAIAVLKTALSNDSSGESHALLGLAYFRLQAYEKAARYYQAALALQPDNAAWKEMLGRTNANAVAEIHIPVPEVYYFDRERLLAPASPEANRLPSAPK